MSRGCRIVGTGMATGERLVTNAELAARLGVDPEWIEQRTGVRQRFVAEAGTRTTDLAERASLDALRAAGVAAGRLDLVIVATITPETDCPSTAARLAGRLGTAAGAWDVAAACAGFVLATTQAAGLIQSGLAETALVVGAEVLTPTCDPADPATASLFGDAAGAAVLTAADDAAVGCVAAESGSDGGRWPLLYVPKAAADLAPGDEPGPYGRVRLRGREVFRFAVQALPPLLRGVCAAADVTVGATDLFCLHQSNGRILRKVAEDLSLPDHRLPVNIDRFGNTGGASVALVLHEAFGAGRLTDATVAFAAVGGGLTWAAGVWRA